MQKVIIIDVLDPKTSTDDAVKHMKELESLVNTFWGFVIIKKIQKKQIPNYKTYIWSWKLEEIHNEAVINNVKLIIINNNLKPKQIFNIQKKLEKDKIKVWDRLDLILKIFEKHATTKASRLQIELASIKHMWPRIFWMWMELSRQWWGLNAKWQWETNTEIMKRHLQKQEKKIIENISKIKKQLDQQRNSRRRKNFKSIAIVWYTNAWKSQLLYSLTKKNIKVKDELFATLDTRIWELFLPNSYKTVLLSDTIGFIQDLPHELIDAFSSTLDEAIHADVLLHVIDFSDPEKYMKMNVVFDVLEKLWVQHTPQIFVCNKIDKIKNLKNKTFLKKYKQYSPVFISALQKNWLKDLVNLIETKI